MTDSNLVISCHCPDIHKELFHVNSTRKKLRSVGTKATYVDPFSCPDRTWKKIKSNSKMVVWGENCPVYFQLTYGLYHTKKGVTYELKDDSHEESYTSKKLFSILNNAYRVLKTGGKAIFGDHYKPDNMDKKLEQMNNHPEIINKFTVEFIPSSESTINLVQEPISDSTFRKYLYVFTKKAKMGTRRSKRLQGQ